MNTPICILFFQHFPELRNYFDSDSENVDLPYLVANELARWFDEQVEKDWNLAKQRMNDFYEIAKQYPTGNDAGDDLTTILQVGFFEKLWPLPHASKTIPAVARYEYLEHEKKYLCQWVGADLYETVMKNIDPKDCFVPKP